MNREQILKLSSMPAAGPSYPLPPFRFVNREYMIVVYQSDPEAIRAAVPEPLVPDPSHQVFYEWIRMPDSSGFGDYTESGVVIPCSYEGRPASFVAQMYLDDDPPIAAKAPEPESVADHGDGGRRPPVVELFQENDGRIVIKAAAQQHLGGRAVVLQQLGVDKGGAAEVALVGRVLGRLAILAGQLGLHVLPTEPEPHRATMAAQQARQRITPALQRQPGSRM